MKNAIWIVSGIIAIIIIIIIFKVIRFNKPPKEKITKGKNGPVLSSTIMSSKSIPSGYIEYDKSDGSYLYKIKLNPWDWLGVSGSAPDRKCSIYTHNEDVAILDSISPLKVQRIIKASGDTYNYVGDVSWNYYNHIKIANNGGHGYILRSGKEVVIALFKDK